MSDNIGLESDQIVAGQLQDFTIDQFAGAFALSLSAVGTLLLVIWQSRCLCRCRLGCSDTCYIFDCAREPPPEPQPEPEPQPQPEPQPEPEPVSPSLPRGEATLREPEPEPQAEPQAEPPALRP